MPKFPTEFFIARRISSRSGAERTGVMTRIASLTVGIGMAVMVVALAVITGFRHQITDNLTGFNAHIQLIDPENSNALETKPVERDTAFENEARALPGCRSFYPFAVKGGILKTDKAIQGIILKGVDGNYDWSFFRKNLVEGETPVVDDTVRNKDILISSVIADMMLLAVGDRVEMLFVREGQAPRRDRFKVSGIYSTGLEELDKTAIITDMRNVQRLNGWDSTQVTGYEVMASSIKSMRDLEGRLQSLATLHRLESGQALMAVDVQQRFPGLFDWLQAHNVNAAVIITIMLLVALLNMISALLIILLERTQMIGTLKALGMRNWPLQKIFLIRSSYIVLRGMFWGNLVALALCGVQILWQPLTLDRTGYFLTHVPVELGLGWWLALNAGSFVVLLLLLAVPTTIVSLMNPDTTLRFR